MTTVHTLGFPRIGARRELKRAVEAYWAGTSDRAELEATGRELRHRHWRQQAEAGVDLVPTGDFSWYDHVLDTTALLGAVPERFGDVGEEVDLDTCFRMARGQAPTGEDVPPCEMTKWFDTNYHYQVPELTRETTFRVATGSVADGTQIHTHMCYAEFHDVIEAIADLDADVISIEASRSDMELLEAFRDDEYPNEIGPGVYDIHSPRVPTADEMARLLAKAQEVIPRERLWVNPDCGLKTRAWDEIRPALANMVAAARQLRQQRAG